MTKQKSAAQLYHTTIKSIMNTKGISRKAAIKVYKDTKETGLPVEAISVPTSLMELDTPEQIIDLSDRKCEEITAQISNMRDEIKELEANYAKWSAISNAKNV